jgi:prolipoprotein diacylglyceryltransferase
MNLFSICIGLGAALGLYSLARSARPKLVNSAIDAGLILLALALAGARTGYVLLHQEYFSSHPGEIAAFWLGGISWVGAAAGLLAGIPLIAWINHIGLREAYRLMIVLAVPLAILGWLGAWTSAVGYGPVIPAPAWLAWATQDETGQVLARLPLQLLCAALLLLFLTLLEAAAARVPDIKPNKIPAAGVMLCADLLLFSCLRADPVREIISLRPDRIAAFFLLLLSLVVLIFPSRTKGTNQSSDIGRYPGKPFSPP